MENDNWEETWEEEPELTEQPVKKSKRILGIPLVLFIAIIVVVILVAAAITYVYIYSPSNTSFTKNITVTAPSGGGGGNPTQNIYVSVVANGDISNSILNCDLDNIGTCLTNTGTITLINNDPSNSHNCTIVTNETDGFNKVTVNYNGLSSNPITIGPSSNVSFSINYTANVSGSYPMQTSINC